MVKDFSLPAEGPVEASEFLHREILRVLSLPDLVG